MMMSSGIDYDGARAPDGIRLYAIGDVHGRLDLLIAMHERIAAELERDRVRDWRIIHLGDYVDRGPDSKGVLDWLHERYLKDSRIELLTGNHDLGFLDFLDSAERDSLFVQYGGVQTAASYGVALDVGNTAEFQRGHAALLNAVPRAHRRLIESLSFSSIFGDFFFCHAGIRPGVALEAQRPDDLVWIRGEFLHHPGLHPKVIVHGHTPHSEPEVLANRVNVDTMAFRSGKLTALVIDGAEKRILSVRGAPGY